MIITLDVRPIGQGKFEGRVDGELIVTSRQPFLDAARALIRAGGPADALFQMRHSTGTIGLKSILGVAASLTIDERNEGRVKFKRWQPHYRSADAEQEMPAAPRQFPLHASQKK
jgi:hypothetical protein